MYKQCAGLFAVAILAACSGTIGKVQDNERAALLKSVPSDAVALVCDRQISALVSVLDPSDKLRQLGIDDFNLSQAVLSYGYTGEKSAMLSIPADTSSAFRNLVLRADSLHLSSARASLDGFDILTISGSETMISECRHHIKSGTSIFNAPFFRDAYDDCGHSSRVAFIRNQAIPRFCPKNFLPELMPRRQLVEFLRGAACWTVVENSNSVRTFQNSEGVFYGYACQSFPTGELRFKEILPSAVRFALSQPAGTPKWRSCRRNYLDANSVLNRYEKAISDYGKDANPEKWELDNRIQEAAVILMPEGKVVALRSSHWNAKACETFRDGFAQLLYGKAYSLLESPTVKICGNWFLAGSQIAVEAVEVEIEKNLEAAIKSCRFYIRTPDFDLYDADGKWLFQLNDNN